MKDVVINILPLDGFDEWVAEMDSERAAKFSRVSFDDVRGATLGSLDYIIPQLLPGGKRVGDEWVVRNPTRDNPNPRAFSINMRDGVWSDFAMDHKGGGMIDLYVYLNGCTPVQAKNALAEMLNVKPRPGSTDLTGNIREIRPKHASVIGVATPADSCVAPTVFPPRTKPDDKGKPHYVVAGDKGPRAYGTEKRRHFYCQGGVPVRIKIVKQDGGAANAYRVTDDDGKTGWQFAKPVGFQPIPYFVDSANPFTAAVGRTIFCTEGEKDVETVAALGGLAFTFGGVGDGDPDGCQQYVVGRPVAILADNDVAGRKHAEDKAALFKPVAASVKIIHFTELAEKGDVSDWIATGKTFEDLKARVVETEAWQPSAKPETEKPEEQKHKLPYGFSFSDRGLMFKDPEDAESKPLHIAGCFDVEAMTRDGDGNGWGLLLRWKDQDGRDHQYALAREHLAGDGAEARRILMDQGFYIAPNLAARSKFNAFLLQVNSPNRALATDRVGWNGTAFVLPDECFGGKQGETLLLQNSTSHEHLFRQSGTLDEWQEIPRLAVGNSRLILAISMAFAGPLLWPCSEEGGGIHFKGSSSIGKTTALHAAGSVWGGGGANGFVGSWRATANGLEGVCVNHSDTLLPLDEMSQVTAKDAGEAAYMMANGSGKSRSSREGTARKSAKFRVLFLSSGEIGLADKVAEDGRGKRMTAGQQVRIVDVQADPGAGLGLFEDLHDFESGKALSKHIVATTRRTYGTAGRAYLAAIVPVLADIRRQAADVMAGFCEQYLPKDADGQVGRVAQRFALIAFAGELAIRLGVIREWEAGTAIAAAATCFEAWLKERGHQGAAEAHGGIEAVRSFLEMHGMSRFVPAWEDMAQQQKNREIANDADVDDTARPIPPGRSFPQRDVCGFRKQVAIGDDTGWDFYISDSGWAEICKGFNPKTLAQTLIEMGALLPGVEAGKTRSKRLFHIPGHRKDRFYHISARFLQGE
jgi:putative DNA primase/helicase